MIKLREGEITDILPVFLSESPEVKAVSFAIKKQIRLMIEMSVSSMVYAGIDSLPENVLDVLAIEMRAPYYDNDFEIDAKREIIKGTLTWNEKSGTIFAIQGLVSAVAGPTEVLEWFDYDGDPYHFKVIVKMESDFTEEQRELVSRLVETYKNVRSYNDGIEFVQIGADVKIKALSACSGFTVSESCIAEIY